MGALKYFSLFIVFSLSAAATSTAAAHRQHNQPEMESVINASNAMFDSGYFTMSDITLWMFDTVLPDLREDNLTGFTIFAPINSAFISNVSGKKEFPVGQTVFLHYSPVYYPLRTLRLKTELPTVSLQYNLIVTSSIFDPEVSICHVKISSPPIYDDGYAIVYSIKQLFNISFAKDMMAGHKIIPVHIEL